MFRPRGSLSKNKFENVRFIQGFVWYSLLAHFYQPKNLTQSCFVGGVSLALASLSVHISPRHRFGTDLVQIYVPMSLICAHQIFSDSVL